MTTFMEVLGVLALANVVASHVAALMGYELGWAVSGDREQREVAPALVDGRRR